jgi:hypothetical protein
VASRAERRVPPAPRLGSAIRAAVTDIYLNSWRFLAGNLIFGVGFLALLAGLTFGLAGWLLAIPLIVPAAGCMRMATTLVRDGHTDFGEFLSVVRRPWTALGLGGAQLGVTAVLVVDLALGLSWNHPAGVFLAVSAGYALLVGWALACLVWPLVLDPERENDPLRARVRLAATLLVAHPIRLGTIALLVGATLAAATVAIAALLTIALAFAFCVLARYVLPAADRLEGRATLADEEL